MARDKADPIIQELYVIRRMMGVTIAEVAERAGINPATISKAELGFQAPRLAVIRAYAEALGLTLALVDPEDTGKL